MLKQVPGSLLGSQLLLQPFQLLAQLHVGAPQLLLAVPGCRCCACFALQVRPQLCYALSLLACLLLHTRLKVKCTGRRALSRTNHWHRYTQCSACACLVLQVRLQLHTRSACCVPPPVCSSKSCTGRREILTLCINRGCSRCSASRECLQSTRFWPETCNKSGLVPTTEA